MGLFLLGYQLFLFEFPLAPMSSTTLIPHPDASLDVTTGRTSTSVSPETSVAMAQTAVARYLRESGWDDGSAMQRAEHLIAGVRRRAAAPTDWMDIARLCIEEAIEHAIRSASYNVVPNCEKRSMGPAIELRPALAMRPSRWMAEAWWKPIVSRLSRPKRSGQ